MSQIVVKARLALRPAWLCISEVTAKAAKAQRVPSFPSFSYAMLLDQSGRTTSLYILRFF